MTQAPEVTATATLFDRIGGAEKVRQIVSETIAAHLSNPLIRSRFQKFDHALLTERAYPFFAAAMGGPETYAGTGLRAVHEGMNIHGEEFIAATDDLLQVLRRHGVGDREQQEVLAAFFAWKDDVLHL